MLATRQFRFSAAILTSFLIASAAGTARGATPHLAVEPELESLPKLDLQFGGFLGNRLKANVNNWELRVPDADPALVQMFYDRDKVPKRDLLPWSGEFIGKYLCAAVLSYRIQKDHRQGANIFLLVHALILSQGTDGYLGPFNQTERLTGSDKWDIWGHYWSIRALLMCYKEFGWTNALQAATRAADLLVNRYLDRGIPFTNDGSFGQMNYAVIHAFTQLYEVTREPRYLAMANWIVKQWDEPGAGQYMKMALAGKEMFEFPGKRWESTHDFLGMADMYFITGDPKYRQAFNAIWNSILKGDRHNTGGFTSGEETTGNPYNTKPIETCSTVGWMDMTLAMLKMTGDPLAADELELSAFNGNLGGQNRAGNWWTYNTPMDGMKKSSADSIHFQCRPGSPDLNCCSVNGPRGLGLVAEWAVMRSTSGIALNYYGPSKFAANTPSGQRVTLTQDTQYPAWGEDQIRVSLTKPESFELRLRIPAWSRQTRVTLNGRNLAPPAAGAYLSLQREWKEGDTINLEFDMSLHFWAGEREYQGLTSIYRGPLLLAFDPVDNNIDPAAIPAMDVKKLHPEITSANRAIQPWVLVKVKAVDGTAISLCDFASAGAYGNYYRSWLPVRGVAPAPFDLHRPVWCRRPN